MGGIPFIWSKADKFNGVDANILYKEVEGDSRGVSIVGWTNYSEGVKDFLIQYATLVNAVRKVPEDAFVLQVGLYNEAGGQYCPVINIRGIKNIPRLIKKAFKKNKLENTVKE